MYWLNLDTLLSAGTSEDQNYSADNHGDPASHSSNHQQVPGNTSRKAPLRPAKRWGQASVAAHNKLYIIGGYEGKQ
jgi:hypothetical protein